MAEKSLITPEDLRKLVHYDPETGELQWRERSLEWFKSRRSCKVWNKRYSWKPCFNVPGSDGYGHGRVMGNNLLGHRVAWAVHFGKWPDGQIDHINGDRIDNRLCNLRVVEPGANSRNRKRTVLNTSGVAGVHFNKKQQVWIATINHNGRPVHLGCFKHFPDAVSVRKEAEVKYDYHPNHGRAA